MNQELNLTHDSGPDADGPSRRPALSQKVTDAIRAALIWIALAGVMICTTLSILGIWQVLHGEDTVWRSVATLGVIIFGCVIAAGVISVGNREVDPLISNKPSV